MKNIYLFIICFVSGLAHSQINKKELIEKLAQPLSEDKIFYRWQSRSSGDHLISSGKFTNNLHKYFMGMKIDRTTMVAGHGVYICENPHGSSQFIRGVDEGSLIEVKIKKGTPYLDLTNSEVMNKMKSLKVSAEDVYRLNPAITVKYDDKNKWWVIKNKEGVEFSPFKGKNIEVDNLFKVLDQIEEEKPKKIFTQELKKILYQRIAQNHTLSNDQRIVSLLSNVERTSALLENLEFSNSLEFHQSLSKINSFNFLSKYLEDPKKARAFLIGLEKYLEAPKILETIHNLPISQKKEITNFMATRSTPNKYLNYLNHLKNQLREENLKLEYGPVPSFTNNANNKHDLQKIEAVLKEINLSPEQQANIYAKIKKSKLNYDPIINYSIATENDSLTDKILKSWKVNLKSAEEVKSYSQYLSKPEDILIFFESIMKDKSSSGKANITAIDQSLEKFLSTPPSKLDLLRLIESAKKNDSHWMVRKMGLILNQARDTDEFILLADKLSSIDTSHSHIRSIQEGIISGLEHFLRLKPDAVGLKKLGNLATEKKWYWIVGQLDNILVSAKDSNQFVTIVKAFNENYKSNSMAGEVQKVILKRIELFLELKPDSKDIKKLALVAQTNDWYWIVDKLDPLLASAKSQNQFLMILEQFSATDKAGFKKHMVETSLLNQLEHFISLQPQPIHITKLLNLAKTRKWTWLTLEKMLSSAKKPEQYLIIADNFIKINSSSENISNIRSTLTSGSSDFLRLKPSFEQFNILDKMLISNEFDLSSNKTKLEYNHSKTKFSSFAKASIESSRDYKELQETMANIKKEMKSFSIAPNSKSNLELEILDYSRKHASSINLGEKEILSIIKAMDYQGSVKTRQCPKTLKNTLNLLN